MIQQCLFEPAPRWPSDWSENALWNCEYSFTKHPRALVQYTHDSGLKLRVFQHIEAGRLLRTAYSVMGIEGELDPGRWFGWIHLADVRPARSEDWDSLLQKCRGVSGQWVFVRELFEALRAREAA